VVGVLAGPFVLGLIPSASIVHLKVINEIALSFIAFAAASELYIKNLRSSLNNIKWLTIGQLGITFTLLVVSIFFIEQLVPFSANLPWPNRLVIAMLISAIFCARSPSSVIPVINEMRAKGSYTSSVMGTTVLLDFLVIILFAMVLSFGIALYEGADVNIISLIKILFEIAGSIALGLGFAFVLKLLLAAKLKLPVKGILLLVLGFIIYGVSDFLSYLPQKLWSESLHLEPLLMCVVAGYRITNYTRYRQEFIKIIHDIGPYIYCAFFTAVGAMLNVQLIYEVLPSALILLALNAVLLFIGTGIGAKISNEPPRRSSVYWMAFLTQAGVGLGLVTTVIDTFPGWGQEFATLAISVIIMNQLIGPPLFKWAITKVGENHERATIPDFDGIRDAIVIGFESQSIALARQLKSHGWEVKLVTRKQDLSKSQFPDVDIRIVENLDLDSLVKVDAKKSEAIVLMLTDEENLKLCELIYEKIGTKDVVVRLNHRYNFDKFHNLGALIVDPSTAMVSLMDHFVRSPQATSLLLGMQEGQDTLDLQVLNKDLYGMPLRDLRLPADIIILSIRRKGQMIISHGYTRLRKGDWVTMVGSNESLKKMTLLFDSTN
ncbi:MAG: cation:proton antiporter, partial [Fulvivirga sp.]|uniref:monovalent cation:proton antiporter family protein n=1 Tax=Fulvivirga sp. TaxID=1931237 RepID=UPI0032EE39B5